MLAGRRPHAQPPPGLQRSAGGLRRASGFVRPSGRAQRAASRRTSLRRGRGSSRAPERRGATSTDDRDHGRDEPRRRLSADRPAGASFVGLQPGDDAGRVERRAAGPRGCRGSAGSIGVRRTGRARPVCSSRRASEVAGGSSAVESPQAAENVAAVRPSIDELEEHARRAVDVLQTVTSPRSSTSRTPSGELRSRRALAVVADRST